jgi:hypothetical protein
MTEVFMKTALSVLTALELSVAGAPALDRYAALSEIESRNNDRMVGPEREVSRYQILPDLWDQAWTDRQKAVVKPTDPVAATTVVKRIMQTRCSLFQSRYHSLPSDFEFYVLWHRPACYIGRPVPRVLSTAEAGRARRFANLCESREALEKPPRAVVLHLPGNLPAGKIFGEAPTPNQPPRS